MLSSFFGFTGKRFAREPTAQGGEVGVFSLEGVGLASVLMESCRIRGVKVRFRASKASVGYHVRCRKRRKANYFGPPLLSQEDAYREFLCSRNKAIGRAVRHSPRSNKSSRDRRFRDLVAGHRAFTAYAREFRELKFCGVSVADKYVGCKPRCEPCPLPPHVYSRDELKCYLADYIKDRLHGRSIMIRGKPCLRRCFRGLKPHTRFPVCGTCKHLSFQLHARSLDTSDPVRSHDTEVTNDLYEMGYDYDWETDKLMTIGSDGDFGCGHIIESSEVVLP